MSESNEVIRDARKLGLPKMLILGLQHMFAMFGATILVPILVNSYFVDACGEGPTRGLTVAVTLFCAGFGTLLFHVCSKMKVPAFLGSSFAFLGGFSTVAHLDTGIYAGMSVNDKAAYAWRRCCCCRSAVSGSVSDHPYGWRETCYEISAAGCYRSGDHLHRFKSCILCHRKCFHQLVPCICSPGRDYRIQYLG